jgi:hypothetical protein
MTNSDAETPVPSDDDATELPALPTWPRVYAFVLGVFVLWVILLTALSRAYT